MSNNIKRSYIIEPEINSELILRNNSKKLDKDETLLNEEHILEIENLREQYILLDQDDSRGLQKKKRDIRNRIRDLSTKTFIHRDPNIFGSMITEMMDKILTRPNFSGYSYKDEMKSLATEHILKYSWKFDSYRQSEISGQFISAFTYISTIIFNAFVATINKQNKELQKAKEDFTETQKLLHKEVHTSTYGEDYTVPKKEVVFQNIEGTLFDLIKQITLDEDDILVKYCYNYLITIEEYNKITDYTKDKNICLSLIRMDKDKT